MYYRVIFPIHTTNFEFFFEVVITVIPDISRLARTFPQEIIKIQDHYEDLDFDNPYLDE